MLKLPFGKISKTEGKQVTKEEKGKERDTEREIKREKREMEGERG